MKANAGMNEISIMPGGHENSFVYAAFDRFPSPKGAASHIDAFVTALGKRFENVDLLTIPSEAAELGGTGAVNTGLLSTAVNKARVDWTPEPEWRAAGVRHQALSAFGESVFERALSFRKQIQHWWSHRFTDRPASIFHFRSIFEGYWIAQDKYRFCRNLVFEVNGLPSIELKYRYPGVAEDRELIRKLRHQEQVCLEAADAIITVSQVNADHLIDRGVSPGRIRIIRNGVDPEQFSCRAAPPKLEPQLPLKTWPDGHSDFSDIANNTSEEITDRVENPKAGQPRRIRLLYAGTMSKWQGVPHAIEALALIRRDVDAELTLVGPARPVELREINELTWKLGVTDFVQILQPVTKSELVKLHHHADIVLAPVTRNDRNLVQGCCPLKIIEAMASGTPLIASDLPVVRELVQDGVNALLVRPGSGKAIKDAVMRLATKQVSSANLTAAARRRVEKEFTWQQATDTLCEIYAELLSGRFSSAASSVPNRSSSALC